MEVFVQGLWQDGRVGLSLCAKISRESIVAQTQAFSHKQAGRGVGFVITKLTGTTVVTTEGSQNELICRSQHTQTGKAFLITKAREYLWSKNLLKINVLKREQTHAIPRRGHADGQCT